MSVAICIWSGKQRSRPACINPCLKRNMSRNETGIERFCSKRKLLQAGEAPKRQDSDSNLDLKSPLLWKEPGRIHTVYGSAVKRGGCDGGRRLWLALPPPGQVGFGHVVQKALERANVAAETGNGAGVGGADVPETGQLFRHQVVDETGMLDAGAAGSI